MADDNTLVTPWGYANRRIRENRKLTKQQLRDLVRKLDGSPTISVRRIDQTEDESKRIRRHILEAVATALQVPFECLVFNVEEAAFRLVEQLYLHYRPVNIELNRDIIDDNVKLFVNGDRKRIPFAGRYNGVEEGKKFFETYFKTVKRLSTDPQPTLTKVTVDPWLGPEEDHIARVVADFDNDIVRHPANDNRILNCHVKLTFEFRAGKLVYFEDLLDTAAWSDFLSGDISDGQFPAPGGDVEY